MPCNVLILEVVPLQGQLKSSGIIRSQITRLSKIEKAEIVVGKSVENHVGGVSHDRDVYGVVLIANDRRISVSGVSTSNYKQKKADVNRINVFLSNPQEYFFKLESDGRWLGLAVGSILLLVGGAVIYALWQIKFVYRAVFDRNSGMLNIVKSSLYGKTEKLDYRLASINELWIEESNSKDNTYYSVNLSCRQSQLTLLRTDNYSEAERLIANLRQFLDRT